LGFENNDDTALTVNYGDNNVIVGLGTRCARSPPTFFNFPNRVPGRPGRSPFYPQNSFNITGIPLGSIGLWYFCGRILIISQLAPKCSLPDRTPPVFTSPSCPLSVIVPTDPGMSDGTFNQCFTATDNDVSVALLSTLLVSVTMTTAIVA